MRPIWMMVTAVLCAGCGPLGSFFSPPRVTRRYAEEKRPCAWLPDEIAQEQLRRSAVGDKVRRLVAPALQTAELDTWLLIEREHQRDPMFESLGLAEPGDKAVLFINADGTTGGTPLRAFAFASSPATTAELMRSGLFESIQSLTPDAVMDTLDRFHPHRIGIDYSGRVALADGIATGTRQFAAWLVGREYAGTFRSAEVAAVAFRAARTGDEIELARQAARCAAEIADRALSDGAIEPGHTTSAELAWRILADIHDARLDASAPPHVSVIKLDDGAHLQWPWLGPNNDTAIATGDLLHLDFDVRYAGVASTLQRTAYVLKRWESEAPAEIRRGFDTIDRVRTGLAPLLRPNASGTQIASDALAWAAQNQVTLDLAAEPVGNTAHDVGTLVRPEAQAGPYEAADVLAERALHEGETQSLAFRLAVRLDNGRTLTLSAGDDAVVGFGGLDFLTPPIGLVLIPRHHD